MDKGDITSSYLAAIEAGTIRGAILTATDASGHFSYNETLGARTLPSGSKVAHQLDDVIFLASATKLMATLAALTCVDDGLLSLRDDLSSVAPELAAKQVLTGFGGSDGATPQLEPASRPITLEMLLTHSAGTSYHFTDAQIGRWYAQHGAAAAAARPAGSGEDFRLPVEELMNYPLGFQPGSGWMYGAGLDWAGRIVERVTGKTLGERLHERVFGPVGVADAQFYPVTREDLRRRMVDVSPEDPTGLGLAVVGGKGEQHAHTKGDFGGHGLFMTAEGFRKVLHSLLANDGKILKRETVDDMFCDHLSPEAAEGLHRALEGPAGVFFRVGTAPGSKAGYGLGGLLTLEDADGWYGDRTLTWGGGLTFAWFVDRKNDLCGVAAIHSAIPIDGQVVSDLKQTFRRDVYRKREEWKKQNAA